MHINQLRLLYFLIVTMIMISSVIYAKPRLLHNGFLALMEWANVTNIWSTLFFFAVIVDI